MILRRCILLADLVFLAACMPFPLGRKDAAGTGLERKVVAQKKKPNILLAVDRTWCETGAKKFDSVKVGDAVWCVWRR